MAKRRGRPTSVNWDIVIPELQKMKDGGATYRNLVDYISDAYGVVVTAQTVRLNLAKAAEKEGRPVVPPPPPVPKNEDADIEAIHAVWAAKPWASIIDIHNETGIPLDTVSRLALKVRDKYDGYTFATPRQAREIFTREDMLEAIVDVAERYGQPEGGTLSIERYAAYRNKLSDEERRAYPSPLVFRRKFGSWQAAVEAAGLTPNPTPRQYDGLSRSDVVEWLALWLRDLRESRQGMVEATVPLYREWLRSHPESPSEELIRLHGAWGELLVEASKLERESGVIDPKPTGKRGRRKDPRPAVTPELFLAPAK